MTVILGWFRWGAPVALFIMVMAQATSMQAALDPQPVKRNSSLVDKDGQRILDSDFASLVKGLLIKNNQTNTRDAKFLFQQCFGGGMLDDIQKALANTVKWVGGSAARHDQAAHDSQAATFASAYWTSSLGFHLNNEPTVLKAFDKTAENLKPLIGKIETAQSIAANGGDTITLKDQGAASHHAILWGGQADKLSHFNSVKRIREILIDKWGAVGQSVSIEVLFRDGQKNSQGQNLPAEWKAKPATKANLIQTINGLLNKMNSNEQFFFYATGHGSDRVALLDEPKLIPGQTVDVEFFDLFPGELEGMASQLDNQPTLTIGYQNLDNPIPIHLNNSLLGTLDPNVMLMEFIVPENLIGLSNEVRIDNLSDFDFMLTEKSFSIGAIDPIDVVAVPEPTSFPLFTLGLLGLAFSQIRVKGR